MSNVETAEARRAAPLLLILILSSAAHYIKWRETGRGVAGEDSL